MAAQKASIKQKSRNRRPSRTPARRFKKRPITSDIKKVAMNTITVIASRSASETALNIRTQVYQKEVRLKKLISGCCKTSMSNAASQGGSAFLKTMLSQSQKAQSRPTASRAEKPGVVTPDQSASALRTKGSTCAGAALLRRRD